MPPRPVGHSGAVQVLPRTACAPPTPREMRVKSIRMTLLGASLLAKLRRNGTAFEHALQSTEQLLDRAAA